MCKCVARSLASEVSSLYGLKAEPTLVNTVERVDTDQVGSLHGSALCIADDGSERGCFDRYQHAGYSEESVDGGLDARLGDAPISGPWKAK